MKQGIRKKGSFRVIDGYCHLKNSELEPQYQKYKGRVVLRGDIFTDDSGAYSLNKDRQHPK